MTLWRPLRALSLVLLIAASAGCQKTALTKVVATDGSAIIGELVESRPDAIVVRTSDGKQVTILRSRIRSIEAPTAAEVYAATGTPAPAVAAAAPAQASGSNIPATQPATSPQSTTPGSAIPQIGTPPGPAAVPPVAVAPITPSSPRSPRATGQAPATQGGSVPAAASTDTTPGLSSGASAPPAPPAHGPRAAMVLAARLDTALASDDSEVDDEVEAILLNPLVVDGRQIVPAGTTVKGMVIASGKDGEGRPELAVRFTAIARGEDDNIPIQASVMRWSGSVQQVAAGEAQSGSFIGKIKKGLGMNKSGTVTVVKPARVARGTPIEITLDAPLFAR